MTNTRRTLSLLILALAASCVSTQKLYEEGEILPEEAAVLREGGSKSFVDSALSPWTSSTFDPSIYVRAIDGATVHRDSTIFHLVPGTHEVLVEAGVGEGGGSKELNLRTLSFEAATGGDYELRGELTGLEGDYRVVVWDLRAGREVARSH